MKKIFIALALGMVLLLAAACTPGQTKIHINPVDVTIDVSPTESITATSTLTSTGVIQRPVVTSTVTITPTTTVTRTGTVTATMPVTNTSGMTETYRVTLQGGNVVTITIPPGATYPDQLRPYLTPVPAPSPTVTSTRQLTTTATPTPAPTKPVTTTFSLTPTVATNATCLPVDQVAQMMLNAPTVADAIQWMDVNYENTNGRVGTTSQKTGFKTGTGPNKTVFLWTDRKHKPFGIRDQKHAYALLTEGGSWGIFLVTEEDEIESPTPGRTAFACSAVPSKDVTKIFQTASSTATP